LQRHFHLAHPAFRAFLLVPHLLHLALQLAHLFALFAFALLGLFEPRLPPFRFTFKLRTRLVEVFFECGYFGCEMFELRLQRFIVNLGGGCARWSGCGRGRSEGFEAQDFGLRLGEFVFE
jgi:hypothetical protein